MIFFCLKLHWLSWKFPFSRPGMRYFQSAFPYVMAGLYETARQRRTPATLVMCLAWDMTSSLQSTDVLGWGVASYAVKCGMPSFSRTKLPWSRGWRLVGAEAASVVHSPYKLELSPRVGGGTPVACKRVSGLP